MIPAARDTAGALTEVSNDPALQGLLAEIGRCCGTRLPALIFRHLATYPGVVPAYWTHLRVLYQGGWLQDAAWPLAEELDTTGLMAPIQAQKLSAIGLDAELLIRAHATLDCYNRSNPVHWLALLTLLHGIDTSEAARTAAPARDRSWQPPPPPMADPLPMVEVGAIDANTRWLFNDLRVGDRSTLDPVVPSLYRHFVPYPALLQLLHQSLAPHFASGRIDACVKDLTCKFKTRAEHLSAQLGPPPELLRQPAVLAAIRDFANRVIPPMLVVGRSLRRALS